MATEVSSRIILLSVDSLRRDCVTSGQLNQSKKILDKDFAYFENSISYGVATPFAFPGIIAGAHPVNDGQIPRSATTIAEAVPGKSIGYSNNGHLRANRGYSRGFDEFEERPSLNPINADEGFGLRDLFDYAVDRAKQSTTLRNSELAKYVYENLISRDIAIPYKTAPEMVDIVRSGIERESPEFVWGHWMDPHLPYHPDTAVDIPERTPPNHKLSDLFDRIIEGDAEQVSDAEIELARELYGLNTRYFDRHLCELLGWLREQSWYEDAFIALVSDHGEYFGEHGFMFHSWDGDPQDELIDAPLWVKYPNMSDAGRSFDHLVGHGDLLATIFDAVESVNVTPPEHTAPLRDTEGRHIVSITNTVKRLTEPDGEYYLRRDGTEEEQGTISDAGKAFAERLEYPKCVSTSGSAQGVEEAERTRRLKQLGYR